MIYLVVIISVLFTTAGNFFQKLAADNKSVDKNQAGSLLSIIFQPLTFFAFVFMAIGAVLWLYVLSKIPVSVAYPFVSLSFVFILLLSKFKLKEDVPKTRWIGILFIVLGVIMVAGG